VHITFNLSHVFYPESSSTDDGYVLRSLLDALIKIDLAYVRKYSPPTLYESGVVYGRTILWEPIPALYDRKFGDCKSLSAARIAELINAGVPAKPVFRWVEREDGGKDFHILVQTLAGFEDPSRKLGMGTDECAKYYQDENNE
jgi:hypothetical protein